jgi:hypothetical protein
VLALGQVVPERTGAPLFASEPLDHLVSLLTQTAVLVDHTGDP